MAASDIDSKPHSPPCTAILSPYRVLIADDDPVLRSQLADFLTSRGATCLLAGSGARAIELIENERPDAAVIDVDLPDMTGIEVAAKVSDLTPAPKVILMSGYDEAYTAACCEKKRAWAVIEKPVPLRVVAHHLCRALERV